MDIVFDAKQATDFEDWALTSAGTIYLRSSQALLDRIMDYHPGWRVLEVGCGLGFHLSYLRHKGLLVHGLEAGPVPARIAARRLGGSHFVDLGDAHDLPYDDNSFDAVIMVNTLELLGRPALALAEAVRVATNRVCLISANAWSYPGFMRFMHWGKKNPLSQGRAINLWTLRRWTREVLGSVPWAWGGATLWPSPKAGPFPFTGLVGLCAAVSPRYQTMPLILEGNAQAPTRAVASTARISVLPNLKS